MKQINKLLGTAVAALATSMFASPAIAAGNAGEMSVARADLFSCSKPVWPAAALAEKRQGTVSLVFEIDAAGKVARSRVEQSSGHADLDEAAREGIAKCAFYPGTENGKPIQSGMQIKYVWTLK